MSQHEDAARRASHETRVAQQGFAMIPIAVMVHPDLSPNAKLVYGYLKHLAWRDRGDETTPAREQIAADLNMAVKAVALALRQLQSTGFILARRRGLGKTNLYVIRDPADVTDSGTSRTVDSGFPERSQSTLPLESSSFREDLTPKTSKQDGPRTVAGAPVTDAEVDDARNLLARFNEHAGTGYQASKWVVLIIRRLRERADLSYGDHEAVLDWALAHPWWRDRPSPSVVYGSEEQYERTVEQARAPAGAGGTLTMDEIRAGVGR